MQKIHFNIFLVNLSSHTYTIMFFSILKSLEISLNEKNCIHKCIIMFNVERGLHTIITKYINGIFLLLTIMTMYI